MQSGNYTLDDVEEALTMVQEFDPPGVAARDLPECLLLQLKVIDPQNQLAKQIITEHLKLLQNNQLKELARAVNRAPELVKRAIDVIKRLDPKPGLRYNKIEPRLVEPDVQFAKVEGEWVALMNDDDLPQLRLSPIYRRLLARDAADRDVRNYVKERFTAAIQLMKNIEQRKHTILRVCQSILRRQKDYLDYGPDHLKPMMIKEVAEEVGVHPSTVSRAVANKYAHMPQGVKELREFFSESVNGPQGSRNVAALPKAPRKKDDRRRRRHSPANRRSNHQAPARRRHPGNPPHSSQISRRSANPQHPSPQSKGVTQPT